MINEELTKKNHSVSTIYLHGKNLNGCMGCGACKNKPLEIGCVQKDDMIDILEEITKADAVILSSPLYFWGVNAQLKTVIDRMYSLYTDAHTPSHSSLIEGKKLAMVITGGGPMENNAEYAFIGLNKMMNYFKTINGGELFIGHCSTPDKMDSSVSQKVNDFIQVLTK